MVSFYDEGSGNISIVLGCVQYDIDTEISDEQIRDKLAIVSITKSASPHGIHTRHLKEACKDLTKQVKPSFD